MDRLRVPPPALTTAQRRVVMAVFAIVIISRGFAISRSIADWDEALFAQGVIEYDVTRDHPHAPGYPMFIVAAKAMRVIAGSEFRALQAVATLASILLFPAVLALARELRFGDSVAIIAATIASFLPTVWYYGGTALSDVPALCAIIAGAALLLRGGRSAPAYIGGALVVAFAVAIRPHMLWIAIVPAIAGAMALRRHRVIVIAWLVALVVVGVSYGAAMLASADPPHGYLRQFRYTQKGVADVDSYRNPGRAPLRQLAKPMFLEPARGGDAAKVLVAFALIALVYGVVRPRAAVGAVIVMFAPLALLTWLMLDVMAASRYAVAYVPMYALLAAEGIGIVASLVRRWENAIAGALAFTTTALFISWAWPALRVARTTNAPVVAAAQWIRENVPRDRTVYVENELGLHAEYLLRGFPHRVVFERTDFAADANRPGNVYVVGQRAMQPGVRVFSRKRGRLASIARPFFFEVTIIPLHTMIDYSEGWYGGEGDERNAWRWMSGQSRAFIPPIASGKGELSMELDVPRSLLPRAPLVTVIWNDNVIERSVWTSETVTKRYVVSSRIDAQNELRITTDITANPKRAGASNDDRDLGLMLRSLSWRSR